jgi:HSP20 family protein
MAIVRYRRDPWRALETMHDELTGLLGAPWGVSPMFSNRLAIPSVDVSEDKENVYVEVEVPGIESKDVDVNLRKDNVLTISAKKEKKEVADGKNYYRSERYYGEYYREVELPSTVDATKIKAKMKDGILSVTLPKKTAEKEMGTKIRVE